MGVRIVSDVGFDNTIEVEVRYVIERGVWQAYTFDYHWPLKSGVVHLSDVVGNGSNMEDAIQNFVTRIELLTNKNGL